MPVAAEPLRRRLTVGVGSAPPMGDDDDAEEHSAVSSMPKAGSPLATLFKETAERKARVFVITSRTDRDMGRKDTFAEKEVETMCSDPTMPDLIEHVTSTYKVAWKCHKGMKPESPNQDSFSICICEDEFALYCVYDGHGARGHDVSDRAARADLVNAFLERKTEGDSMKDAFMTAFTRTQKVYEDVVDFAAMSGTTATMAYHCLKQRKLWIAHVGDSRAVLALRSGKDVKAQDLTIDHKPNLGKERERIERNGGRVVFDGFFNHRVFAQTGMYPGLNMSRALGDVVAHREAGLTAEPDVEEFDLSTYMDNDEVVLLLCTDGVWEFLESSDVANHIMAGKALDNNLKYITEQSFNKWMEDSNGEISDDITGIAVKLVG